MSQVSFSSKELGAFAGEQPTCHGLQVTTSERCILNNGRGAGQPCAVAYVLLGEMFKFCYICC